MSDRSYSVTLTRGLINALTDQELECVIAHELTHIRNRDVQLLVATSIVAGVAPLACDFLLMVLRGFMWVLSLPFRAISHVFENFGAILAPYWALHALIIWAGGLLFRALSQFFSLLMSVFISRKREFMADAGAIELTKNPDALVSALKKVSGNSDVPTKVEAVRQMYFINPLRGILSTHPSIDARIEAIVAHARQGPQVSETVGRLG